MTLGEHQQAFSRDLVALLQFAFDKGYEVRIGEVYRTAEQQRIYVETGRSKTMNSNHLKKCAADLHWFKDGELCYPKELGSYWQSLSSYNRAGMFWKGFRDDPHYERNVP